jgi:carotenoid cleavage dioxygenase-like enzyme
LTRFSMNMKTGKANVEQLFDMPMEFPQVNRNLWTRPYRYGYSLAVDAKYDSAELIDRAEAGIRKYDLQTGDVDAYMPGNQYIPGEAIFVPASESAIESGGAEDEGYLVSYIYDKNTNTSDFCILDASNVSAGPIAKVKLPVRVPVGFHGVWVPESALS